MKNQMFVLAVFVGSMMAALPATANLDVVFLLDTTGSMASEIREVKERVVQLSAALGETRKGETVRFGVVAYRDRGDAYVTKVSPLSTDVSKSERFLGVLNADGGGDGPEDVLSGLRDALGKMKWTGGRDTERQIFLIGDAPPHLDYKDGPKPDVLIELAIKKRVVVNAIGCRSLSSDGIRFFRELAFATEGSYQHIGRVQSGKRGVADAMLDKLVSRPIEVDFAGATVVPFHRSPGRGRESDSDVVLVRHEIMTATGDASKCGISVHWPGKVTSATDPKILNDDGELVVILAPMEGTGDTEWFQFEDCRLADAPIHVRMGGAR